MNRPFPRSAFMAVSSIDTYQESKMKLLSLLCIVVFVLAVGCGKSNLGKVTGVVTQDGQPVTTGGSVMFTPQAADGKAGVGAIGPDGSYVISTYGDEDGAVIGSHRVVISLDEPAEGKPLPTPPALEYEVGSGQNVFDIELSKLTQK